MKNQKHIWVVKRKMKDGSIIPIWSERIRDDARMIADFLNGFAKGKRDAIFSVKKYREVE
jgi:hypothetical protein